MADLANEDKPALAPAVFVFQKDKAQKRSAEGSSAEDGEDSDKDEGSYCPPVKRERTSSFPPPHSVPKNNVFMPPSFCQSPTGNSDSEPEEKPVGFRLKPPTLIHGQAPSSDSSCGTNGVKKSPDGAPGSQSLFLNNTEHTLTKSQKHENEEDGASGNKDGEKKDTDVAISFVFGQNIKDRAKLEENSTEGKSKDGLPLDAKEGTNYFLQYISTPSPKKATNSTDTGAKFVFGQNMSERVLSPPKGEPPVEETKEVLAAPAPEPSSQETPPEKAANSVSESLEESAAAYTKATAKKCVLEKVDVKTGEESESNVLQMQCKLYVFEKTAQSWIERGRGLLRLNDMASTEDGTLQSRLVMRTQGSLRLILNTKLWAQMQVDKASEKSVRVTAMDTEDQGVKVFLISASSKDIGQLAAALHHRILALKSRADQEPETPTTTIPDAEVPQSDDSDEEDNASASASASTPATSNSEGGESQATGST
ncbi:ran-binding protein 3b isoform X4 [Gymnodraco acuticeps]|uniref:Ran-binding protein 3 n=1 Tax=Gymnodraco acuticeps TaxID=8218 RepID=A0A6P8U349_GYMAC|nr:ran-binding protein 3b isoform X3 [Pseudochaenichthys georgianus]XP_034065425.1 ran-binding protein 3b isoform X4 [Gymnodraco acuticeps]